MKFSLLLVWSGRSVLINGSTLGKKVIEVGGNETRSKAMLLVFPFGTGLILGRN